MTDIQQWTKAHAFELGLVHEPSQNIMKDRSIRMCLTVLSFPSYIPLHSAPFLVNQRAYHLATFSPVLVCFRPALLLTLARPKLYV